MKIAALCAATNVSRSTIHSYLRMGLIPPPTKTGLNLHLYDERHVRALRTIRYLREHEGYSLAEIKEAMSGGNPVSIPSDAFSSSATTGSGAIAPNGDTDSKHRQIIEQAIYLFAHNGYENVKISDITNSLHMGKGTFYLYFKNKIDLLLECFDTLRSLIRPLEQDDQIRQEEDFYKRMGYRWINFQRVYSKFPGILNLLRTAALSSDLYIQERARQSYDTIIKPLRDDITQAISQGVCRPIDPELAAYMLWGLAEHTAFRMSWDNRYERDAVAIEVMGVLKRVLQP